MERIFASDEPLDATVDGITTCSERLATPIAERVLPDGAVHLIFNLGDRPGGERNADLACLAMGPTCEPTRIVLAGALEQVCVRLRVGAAAAVLGVPAGAITDLGVALDELWGAAATETLDRLAAAPRDARPALIAEVLGARLRRAEPPSPVGLEALRRIAASAGRVRVRELAADVGVSERRLQQIFHEQIGLSPKETCRLARFRAVVARRRRDPARSWIDVALDAGFYDQAHLVHELKAFTGLTPGQLSRQSDDFGFFQDAATALA